MNVASFEIVEAGAGNTVQDMGRRGLRGIGVPVGGAADPVLAACANRLLGNVDNDAVIEIPLWGPSIRAVDRTLRCVLVGDVQARLQRDGQPPAAAATYQTLALQPKDVLHVGVVRQGIAYLSLEGGCCVPMQLGSRSTYARAGLGGVHGRALQAGDRIEALAAPSDDSQAQRAAAFAHVGGPVRVMPGPQDDAFTDTALVTLLNEPYRISRESDRLGMRLEGPKLQHCTGADVCSEGVVPGSIQVPGNGEPIVLLADAQTVGGYTKIATVIRADLPRLAHARPGDELRFVAVTREQALQAWAQLHAALDAWTRSIQPYQPPGHLDLERLYDSNLLSGMIDARRETLPWEPVP